MKIEIFTSTTDIVVIESLAREVKHATFVVGGHIIFGSQTFDESLVLLWNQRVNTCGLTW